MMYHLNFPYLISSSTLFNQINIYLHVGLFSGTFNFILLKKNIYKQFDQYYVINIFHQYLNPNIYQ